MSARSLLHVIDDILDFSKIEARRLEIRAESFPLRQVLDETVRALDVQAHSKGLSLTLAVAPDVPAQAIADGPRIRQVLVNLIGNAMKFTDKGGITVTASCQGRADRARLQIRVVDTGVGIPQEKLATILEPFAQADGLIRAGTGARVWGSSTSTRLVALMGGALAVDSAPGEGSTFSFWLPIDIQLGSRPPASAIARDEQANRRLSRADRRRQSGQPAASVGPAGQGWLRRAGRQHGPRRASGP